MANHNPIPLPLSPQTIARFWSKVAVKTDAVCWEWRAGRNNDGYGVFEVKATQYRSNRIAYALIHGTDPDEMLICHTCDNPPCCNPYHLFLGTAKGNNGDMARKGRAASGERNSKARFTAEQITEIRTLFDSGHYTTRQLAYMFKATHSGIWNIVSRKVWKHLP